MARSYEQGCHIARALDVLGERWTLLIARELVAGPRRYGDLLEALPGIGTSLLAARLKHLEQHRVVRQVTLPGPGHVAAYALGERGEALLPVLAALSEWGGGLADTPPGYADNPVWSMIALRLRASAGAASFGVLTELTVGGKTVWLQGDGERVRMETGPAPTRPGLRLSCAKDTFYALVKGRTTVEDAVSAGQLAIDGEPGDSRLFFALFGLPQAA